MNVFVTGASGWIGSAVVPQLLAAGHQVVGLARSDGAAAAVAALGAEVRRGDLDDLDSLRAGAEASDGVIHLGFKPDVADFAGAGRTERDATPMVGPEAPRGGAEELALSYAERGVRSVSLRFALTVHGAGDHGFVPTLVGVARERGTSCYVGAGTNRWPAVHRLDAARLVRSALERSPAGSVVHGVAEEGVPTRAIAEAIGRGLGVPVRSVDPDDAAGHFGWIGMFFAVDAPASSALTRDRLGWTPTQPGLIEDLDAGSYFRT